MLPSLYPRSIQPALIFALAPLLFAAPLWRRKRPHPRPLVRCYAAVCCALIPYFVHAMFAASTNSVRNAHGWSLIQCAWFAAAILMLELVWPRPSNAPMAIVAIRRSRLQSRYRCQSW